MTKFNRKQLVEKITSHKLSSGRYGYFACSNPGDIYNTCIIANRNEADTFRLELDLQQYFDTVIPRLDPTEFLPFWRLDGWHLDAPLSLQSLADTPMIEVSSWLAYASLEEVLTLTVDLIQQRPECWKTVLEMTNAELRKRLHHKPS